MTPVSIRRRVDEHELRSKLDSFFRDEQDQAITAFDKPVAVLQGLAQEVADPFAPVDRVVLELDELLADGGPGCGRRVGDPLREDALEDGGRQRDALGLDE